MYEKLRPLLFKLDPELAHDLTLVLLRLAGWFWPAREILRRVYPGEKCRPVSFAGLEFPNQVGLAAGYDKDGTAWRGLACLGFGHIELGTVTPRPQAGNPRPRIFRLPEQDGIINRMGFPGRGSGFLLERIPPRGFSLERDRVILGVNIGRNKDTPNQSAGEDYLACLRTFYSRADYIAVNVSSPNTIGLRELQGRQYLHDLLWSLVAERDRLMAEGEKSLPLLVKLSPDLTDSELDEALEAVTASGVDGVVATNTTVQRENLLGYDPGLAGGLSGRPLRELSTEMIRKIRFRAGEKLPIIGVGGISSARDAREKLDAGADLVQLYSGLIYQGPSLVKEIITAL
jgi:dihydroorotate dehydrogenase